MFSRCTLDLLENCIWTNCFSFLFFNPCEGGGGNGLPNALPQMTPLVWLNNWIKTLIYIMILIIFPHFLGGQGALLYMCLHNSTPSLTGITYWALGLLSFKFYVLKETFNEDAIIILLHRFFLRTGGSPTALFYK